MGTDPVVAPGQAVPTGRKFGDVPSWEGNPYGRDSGRHDQYQEVSLSWLPHTIHIYASLSLNNKFQPDTLIPPSFRFWSPVQPLGPFSTTE